MLQHLESAGQMPARPRVAGTGGLPTSVLPPDQCPGHCRPSLPAVLPCEGFRRPSLSTSLLVPVCLPCRRGSATLGLDGARAGASDLRAGPSPPSDPAGPSAAACWKACTCSTLRLSLGRAAACSAPPPRPPTLCVPASPRLPLTPSPEQRLVGLHPHSAQESSKCWALGLVQLCRPSALSREPRPPTTAANRPALLLRPTALLQPVLPAQGLRGPAPGPAGSTSQPPGTGLPTGPAQSCTLPPLPEKALPAGQLGLVESASPLRTGGSDPSQTLPGGHLSVFGAVLPPLTGGTVLPAERS